MSSKTDALDKYLQDMLAGLIESLTKIYWRCQRWKTSARMSEGEDRSSAMHNEERI